ncbi:hypothetical protein T440DRAFT_403811, partial [Plenodomus tracheiphilus IPT5]
RGAEHKNRSLPPSDLRQSGNLRYTCLLCTRLYFLDAIACDAIDDCGRHCGTVEAGGGEKNKLCHDVDDDLLQPKPTTASVTNLAGVMVSMRSPCLLVLTAS